MNPYIKRTIIDISVFVAILVLPWWLSAVILFILTIYFSFYLEVLFFGFLFDTLYGHSHTGMLISLVFLVVVIFIKTKIRM